MNKKKNQYLIKYWGDAGFDSSCPTDLYWGPSEDWVKDPRVAVRFTKDNAIHIIGKLLVEQEWVTKLVPLDDVPQVRNPEPPTKNFVVICDVNGEPQCCYSSLTLMEIIFNIVKELDEENPKNSPHAAWQSTVGGFTLLFK